MPCTFRLRRYFLSSVNSCRALVALRRSVILTSGPLSASAVDGDASNGMFESTSFASPVDAGRLDCSAAGKVGSVGFVDCCGGSEPFFVEEDGSWSISTGVCLVWREAVSPCDADGADCCVDAIAGQGRRKRKSGAGGETGRDLLAQRAWAAGEVAVGTVNDKSTGSCL